MFANKGSENDKKWRNKGLKYHTCTLTQLMYAGERNLDAEV
jgi:hypothetical protein